MSDTSQVIIVKNADGSTGQLAITANGLKVDAQVTANVYAVQIKDATDDAKLLKVNADGSINTTGAGTTTINDPSAPTQKLAVDAEGKIGVNALPSVTLGTDSVGLAREAGGNLAAIKADTDKIPSKGTAAVAGSTPVTIATDDTLISAIKTDLDKIPSSPAQESGNLASIKTDVDKIPSKGSATMSGSTPVTIATDDTVMLAIKGVPSLLNTPSAYTSTASYASAISGPLVITRGYKGITVNIKENNVNAVMYQIVGYTEASGFTRPIVLATALDVAKNGGDYQIVEMPLLAIDVQAVDKVGGTHGSVTVDIVLG